MILTAAVIAAATLSVGFLVAVSCAPFPTLRLQIAGLAAFAVCVPLAVVLLSGWVMSMAATT